MCLQWNARIYGQPCALEGFLHLRGTTVELSSATFLLSASGECPCPVHNHHAYNLDYRKSSIHLAHVYAKFLTASRIRSLSQQNQQPRLQVLERFHRTISTAQIRGLNGPLVHPRCRPPILLQFALCSLTAAVMFHNPSVRLAAVRY